MIALPITIKHQSKAHVCLYDAAGKYLATTPTQFAEMVKAAFEASVANGNVKQNRTGE